MTSYRLLKGKTYDRVEHLSAVYDVHGYIIIYSHLLAFRYILQLALLCVALNKYECKRTIMARRTKLNILSHNMKNEVGSLNISNIIATSTKRQIIFFPYLLAHLVSIL